MITSGIIIDFGFSNKNSINTIVRRNDLELYSVINVPKKYKKGDIIDFIILNDYKGQFYNPIEYKKKQEKIKKQRIARLKKARKRKKEKNINIKKRRIDEKRRIKKDSKKRKQNINKKNR